MGKFLKDVSEFIAKLERVNFTKVDGDTLISDDGFELSYHTKFQTLMGSREDCKFVGLPVQLIFRIVKEGVYVSSWGCMDLEDTTELAKWYKLKHSDLQREQDDKERKVRDTFELVWNNK